jgi:uncharacterized protein (TIGR03067 family)
MLARSCCFLVTFLLISTVIRAADPPAEASYDQSGVKLEQDVLPGGTKIVLIAGRMSHGPMEHEFFAGTAILQKMLVQNGINAVMARDGWPKDDKVFDGAAAVMIYADGGGGHPMLRKSGDKSRLDMMKALLAKGVGFANLHYAVEYPKENAADVLPMLGGYFEPFWSVNPHWDGNFKTLPQHPITRGVKPFKIRDEWYYHMKFVDGMKGVTPILTDIPPDATRGKPGVNDAHGGNPEVQKHQGKPEHVAWAYERQDGGRSFGFTGGHFHKNWGDENFRRLVVNALMWTAKADVPEAGAKVEMDSTELTKNLDDKKSKPRAAANDIAKLQGEWAMKSGVADGFELPEDMARNFKRICKGNELSVMNGDQLIMKANITIDQTKSPKTIDYEVIEGPTKGNKHLGIYELNGDTFKSCFGAPDAPRPKEFKSESGDRQTFSIWNRAKSQ